MSTNIIFTVDAVVFAINDTHLEVLLIQRKQDPYKNYWALPGGLVKNTDETLDAAIARELYDETNVADIYLEQLYTFGDRGSDTSSRLVSVAYLALTRQENLTLKASSSASCVGWWPVNKLPKLAFDHTKIINYARQRLKYKVEYSAHAFKLLDAKFTLRDLQSVYEAILNKSIDNRNFRKKFLSSGVLRELDETSQESSYRPARLYAFSETDFEQLPDRPVFVF